MCISWFTWSLYFFLFNRPLSWLDRKVSFNSMSLLPSVYWAKVWHLNLWEAWLKNGSTLTLFKSMLTKAIGLIWNIFFNLLPMLLTKMPRIFCNSFMCLILTWFRFWLIYPFNLMCTKGGFSAGHATNTTQAITFNFYCKESGNLKINI